jgi:ubiquinone/menaquinone biosynthesis C-methylase UbiE
MDSFYDRYWADRGEVALSDFDVKWPKLRKFVPDNPGAAVLDLGCGNGTALRAMHEINREATYTGLDVADKALEMARKSAPFAALHRIQDGDAFPVASESIDFVFCSEVIEHVYDTANAFAEIARILRAGGRLLITTPVFHPLKSVLYCLFRWERTFDPTGPHIRFFSRRSLYHCLECASLAPLTHGYYSAARHYGWLIRGVIYVLAEKPLRERARPNDR